MILSHLFDFRLIFQNLTIKMASTASIYCNLHEIRVGHCSDFNCVSPCSCSESEWVAQLNPYFFPKTITPCTARGLDTVHRILGHGVSTGMLTTWSLHHIHCAHGYFPFKFKMAWPQLPMQALSVPCDPKLEAHSESNTVVLCWYGASSSCLLDYGLWTMGLGVCSMGVWTMGVWSMEYGLTIPKV